MTTPDEIREDIELHRAELAQTVDLLADKLNVKANVKATAAKKVEPLQPYRVQIAAGGAALVALLVVLKIRKHRS